MVVVLTWVGLIVLGWTLIYWPHLSRGFFISGPLRHSARGGLLDALYLSMVTVATPGFGDIVPTDEWLRVAVPLLGFVLLTATVTWVLQIYPALTRRRALAVRLSLLTRADTARMLAEDDLALTAPLLTNLADDLVQARVDLAQYAETSYFRDGEGAASLAANLGTTVRLASAARASPRADTRFAGHLLASALGDFAHVLEARFLRAGGGLREVLGAYATGHGHGPPSLE